MQDNLGILFTPAEHPALFVLGSRYRRSVFLRLVVKSQGVSQCRPKGQFQRGVGSLNNAVCFGADFRDDLRHAVLELYLVTSERTATEPRAVATGSNTQLSQ